MHSEGYYLNLFNDCADTEQIIEQLAIIKTGRGRIRTRDLSVNLPWADIDNLEFNVTPSYFLLKFSSI